MAQIHVENLTFQYSGGFSLDIQSCRFGGREAGVISGPGGAGKTTLMRLLAGILKPTGGQILVENPGGGRAGNPVFLAEAPGILTWISGSVIEEFRLLAEFRDLAGFRRGTAEMQSKTVAAMLEHWHIPCKPGDSPRSLSQSNQNLLILCLAEFSQAAIVLVDGIIEVLDPQGTRTFISLVERLVNENRSLYICSNETERFLAHMDRMMLIKDGKLILDALPERVLPFLDAHGLRKPGMKLKEMTWTEGGA